MNINKSKFLDYINITLAILTGIVALILTWDLVNFTTDPEGYDDLIGEGSNFGCNYQSVTNYIIFSATGSISMIIAFVSGFFFKDESKAILARICFIIAAYAIEFILTAIMCP